MSSSEIQDGLERIKSMQAMLERCSRGQPNDAAPIRACIHTLTKAGETLSSIIGKGLDNMAALTRQVDILRKRCNEVEASRDEALQKMQSQRAGFDTEILRIKAEKDKDIIIERKKSQDQVNRCKAECEVKQTTHKQRCDDDLSKHVAAAEEELRQHVAENDRDVKLRIAQNDQRLAIQRHANADRLNSHRSAFTLCLARQRSNYDSSLAQMERDYNSRLQAAIGRKEEQVARHIQAHTAELNGYRRTFTVCLARVRSDCDSRLAQMKSDYDSRLQAAVAREDERVARHTQAHAAELNSYRRTFIVCLARVRSDCDSRLAQMKSDYDSRLAQMKSDYDSRLAQTKSDCDSRLQAALAHNEEQLETRKRSYEEAFNARLDETAKRMRQAEVEASDRFSQSVSDFTAGMSSHFQALSTRLDTHDRQALNVCNDIRDLQVEANEGIVSLCRTTAEVSNVVKSQATESDMSGLSKTMASLGSTLAEVKKAVESIFATATQTKAAVETLPNAMTVSIWDGVGSLDDRLKTVLEHVQSVPRLGNVMNSINEFMVSLKELPDLNCRMMQSLGEVASGQTVVEGHLQRLRADRRSIICALEECRDVLARIEGGLGSIAASLTGDISDVLSRIEDGKVEVMAALAALGVSADSLAVGQASSSESLHAAINRLNEDVVLTDDTVRSFSRQVASCCQLVSDQFSEWRVRIPATMYFFACLRIMQSRQDLAITANAIMDTIKAHTASALADLVPDMTRSVSDVVAQSLPELLSAGDTRELIRGLPDSEAIKNIIAGNIRSLISGLPDCAAINNIITDNMRSLLSAEDARGLINGLPDCEAISKIIAGNMDSLLSAEDTRTLIQGLPTTAAVEKLVAPIAEKVDSLLSGDATRKLIIEDLPASDSMRNAIAPIAENVGTQMRDGFDSLATVLSSSQAPPVDSQPSTSSEAAMFDGIRSTFWGPAGNCLIDHLTAMPIVYTRNVMWGDVRPLLWKLLQNPHTTVTFRALVTNGPTSQLYCFECLVTARRAGPCRIRDGCCSCRHHKSGVILTVVEDGTYPGRRSGFGLEKRQ